MKDELHVVFFFVIVVAHGSWRFVGTLVLLKSSKIDPSMDVSGGPLERFMINSFLASRAYAFTILFPGSL